jgi:hypothetical protein
MGECRTGRPNQFSLCKKETTFFVLFSFFRIFAVDKKRKIYAASNWRNILTYEKNKDSIDTDGESAA